MEDWPKDAKCQFLDAIQARPALYDPSNEGYRMPSVTRQAWKEVCELLPTDLVKGVHDAKMKWQNLIKYYKRLKLNSVEVGTEPAVQPKWTLFNKMDEILKDIVKLRESAPSRSVSFSQNEGNIGEYCSVTEGPSSSKGRKKRKTSMEYDFNQSSIFDGLPECRQFITETLPEKANPDPFLSYISSLRNQLADTPLLHEADLEVVGIYHNYLKRKRHELWSEAPSDSSSHYGKLEKDSH